jgi:NAD(P)-dependent dehydrogenase (short-subunit alcohol dehydrogenase family)
MRIKGKVVWITGSGRGIGSAIARALAARRARVVVSARTEDDIAAVAGEINADGDSALAIPCDVRDPKQIDELVRQTTDLWGTIDILINNAGIAHFKKIIETTPEEWDAMMDTNLKSAFLCSQAVLPAMLERQSGHIINIVSVGATQPYYNSGGYCASKYGLLGFTEVLRMETRKHGIKVTAMLPGATHTDIWGGREMDAQRMMAPEDVARAVVAVCEADAAAMIESIVMRPQGGDL